MDNYREDQAEILDAVKHADDGNPIAMLDSKGLGYYRSLDFLQGLLSAAISEPMGVYTGEITALKVRIHNVRRAWAAYAMSQGDTPMGFAICNTCNQLWRDSSIDADANCPDCGGSK